MPYTYIERAYGRKFEAGQRVKFTEGKERFGVVRGVRDDPQYVQVLFDGMKHASPCHPDSVEVVSQPNR